MGRTTTSPPPEFATPAPARSPGRAPAAPLRRTPAARPPVAHAPIARKTLAAATVDALTERILSGAYPEGEPLRQDAIAAELGVSRIPVREALRQLEAAGLVTVSPHRGAVVSSRSTAEIDELFALRALVEAELMRRSVPDLSPEDLARADDILTAYTAAFRRRDIAAWGELNWRFHSTLYAGAGRPLTLGIAEHLHRQTDRYARMQLALTHGESRAGDEHRAILRAARRRKADRAAELLVAHILDAGRALVRFLEQHRSGR